MEARVAKYEKLCKVLAIEGKIDDDKFEDLQIKLSIRKEREETKM
jgi:hypothetical protein